MRVSIGEPAGGAEGAAAPPIRIIAYFFGWNIDFSGKDCHENVFSFRKQLEKLVISLVMILLLMNVIIISNFQNKNRKNDSNFLTKNTRITFLLWCISNDDIFGQDGGIF